MKFEFSFWRFLEGMYPRLKGVLYCVAATASFFEGVRLSEHTFLSPLLMLAGSLCFHRFWVLMENGYAEA